MIAVNNISVSFSGKDLFKDLSFIINPKDRIGLVGKNGVGKSTLLKIIYGIQPSDQGGIAISEGRTMGYLPQEVKIQSDKTIYDEALTVFEEIIQLEKDIDHINKQLEERTDYESEGYNQLIHDLTDKHEKLNLLDSSKIESNVGKVLKGLGFTENDFHRKMSEFSGGWQMRVELGKLLLLKPDLLLLDEPTNHLDIESILWLEDYFNNYPGALIMISHDRAFLDNVTNRTIEIVFGRIYDYKVPYSKYFELREERMEHQMAALKNQQKYIEQQERFIERFKAKATKAKQAQARQKQLDKIERIEIDELDNQSIEFRFPPAPRSGDVVVKADEVSKSYDEKKIFTKASYEIERGEKVAFVGKNGMGKSTMIKIITEGLEHQGDFKVGHNVKIGYYAQIQENTLNQEQTVLETIEHAVTSDEWSNISRIRGLLGAFLFGEDDIDKRVKVLSGGEKSRLALAKLLLEPVNLLILDEPTNHLDIASKEVLKNALKKFDGTLILVSHDRDFLKGLTEKTYEFINGRVKEHLGDIDYFLSKHKVETFRDFESAPVEQKEKQPKKEVAPQKEEKENVNTLSFEERKALDKEIRKVRSDIGKREKKVDETEKAIEELEAKMADPASYEDGQPSKKLFFEHSELSKQLEQYMTQWEALQEQLDELEKQRAEA
ncbi:MAG: glycosyl transferase family 2 [Crocinitomicaceae bacterium]|nr:glycosyl transferase family 2 [Crocinitomicaceae bacterium]|tara:strand:+ start:2921 stop:4912 length:1992 start_codon:yes stop_codon:yes gene_type:complete